MRRGERSEVRCTGPRLHEGVVPLPLLPLPEGGRVRVERRGNHINWNRSHGV